MFTINFADFTYMNSLSSPYTVLVSEEVSPLLTKALHSAGYQVTRFGNTRNFSQVISSDEISVIILKEDEYTEFEYLLQGPHAPCIVLAGSSSALLKNSTINDSDPTAPWIIDVQGDQEKVLLLIAKACIIRELRESVSALKSAISTPIAGPQLVAVSPVMRELFAKASVLAPYDTTVLITGESGTGKTSLAAYIHSAGNRAQKPFLSISCAAIPRDLLEAELFGYEKGSFTSASSARAGAFELADGGTIFLDEIGDLPLELQPKLLTVLQDKQVRRIGSAVTKKCNVRIIVATNRDLKDMCRRKEFRDDLYFRLNVVALHIPPLRERTEDITPLLNHAIARLSEKLGKRPPKVNASIEKKISQYPWPGNIRELENVVERTLILTNKDLLTISDFGLDDDGIRQSDTLPSFAGIPLATLERKAILDTLTFCKGDKKIAAELLNISLKTLYNKLKGIH